MKILAIGKREKKKPGEIYNKKMIVKLIDGQLYWGDFKMKYAKPEKK